jgi:hypothetical protein
VPAASATATLSAAALRDGETYRFAVTVRDFLGAEAVASLEVAKAGVPVPLVSAAGPRARVHPRAAALQLVARVQPSACAPPGPLSLFWRLAGGPPVPDFPVGPAAESPALFLPPGALRPGARYEFALAAGPRGAPPLAECVVRVAIPPDPTPAAAIVGGNRVVRAGAALQLDVGVSAEGAGDGVLRFEWSCAPAPCFPGNAEAEAALARDAPRVVIPGAAVTPGIRAVRVRVLREPGARAAEAVAAIEAVAARASRVLAAPAGGAPAARKVSAELRLALRGAALWGEWSGPPSYQNASAATPDAEPPCAGARYTWAEHSGHLDFDSPEVYIYFSASAPANPCATTICATTHFSVGAVYNVGRCCGRGGPVKYTTRQVLATPRGAPLLVLRAGALVAGRQYLFSLSAACPGEVLCPCSPCKMLYTTLAKRFARFSCEFHPAVTIAPRPARQAPGRSTVAVVVNSPPVGGEFAVAPASGVEMETTFTLSMRHWTDDSDDLPIRYRTSREPPEAKLSKRSCAGPDRPPPPSPPDSSSQWRRPPAGGGPRCSRRGWRTRIYPCCSPHLCRTPR